MVSKQTELTSALKEYRRLSAEIQDICEDIISTPVAETEWADEIRRNYQGFLEDDAEILKAFNSEIEKASNGENAAHEEQRR